jgi:hypothetical protein
MTNNLTAWLVLAAIVVVTLVWKGYIKLPSQFRQPRQLPSPRIMNGCDSPIDRAPSPVRLEEYGSHALAVAFARSARREAEDEVAFRMADDAARKIRQSFMAPFSVPAPETTTGSAQGANSAG